MLPKSSIIRIAKPTINLCEITRMYIEGLGFELLGEFNNHNGFDGRIIGHKNHCYHLEFTYHHNSQLLENHIRITCSCFISKTRSNGRVFVVQWNQQVLLECHHLTLTGMKKVKPTKTSTEIELSYKILNGQNKDVEFLNS